MKKITIFLFLLMCGLPAFSQSNLYFKIAYNGGMITNPGLSLGAGTSPFHWERNKKNGGLVQKEIRTGISMSLYHHRRLNTGLNVGPEIEFIRTGPKGAQIGLVGSFGYLKTFIPNTFSVSDVGEIHQLGANGTEHFFVDVGLKLGKDLQVSRSKNLEWFIKPKLQFQRPYFEGQNRYFFLESGLILKAK